MGALVLYIIAYITGGWFGLMSGLGSLRERTIDVDLLMVLAALGAFYIGAPFEGAMLLFLFSFSNVLQDFAMDRTRSAIKSLMKLRPNQATVLRNDKETTLFIEQVVINDIFIVKPGDRIPLDGIILKGESSVDQSSVTGESMPVVKVVGNTVFAGTINGEGNLEAKVIKLAKDSTIAKLILMVEEARSQKAQTQRFLDTAEQYYAMGVIAFTALVVIVPMFFLNETFNTAFYRAMTVMVAASPCALIISTPAAILSAIGNGARQGILFKGGVHVENAASIKVIAFDKTGTLTEGKPVVTDITPIDSKLLEDDLLRLAASLEAKSQHPLGQAIVEAAEKRQLTLLEVNQFQAKTGRGIRGIINDHEIWIGNLRYFDGLETIGHEATSAEIDRLQTDGKTAMVVAQMSDSDDGKTARILGVIAVADKVRDNVAEVIRDLKSMGIERIVMLTGDHQQVAQAIANQVGVDEFYAGLLPEDKVELVKKLRNDYGPIAMVGDGVNDAPALASATIGVAMGAAGSDVALETADIVLLSDKLSNIPYFIDLSQQTRRTLLINLGFSLTMIVLMIVAIFTIELSLPLAVLGHEGGTVLVSLNGLALLLYKRQSRET
jgi:Cd2+/Zn2+-exporting ATPase